MRDGLMISLLGLGVTFAALTILAGTMWVIGRFDVWRRQVMHLRILRHVEDRFEAGERAAREIPPETVAVITAVLEALTGRPIRVHTVRYLRDPRDQSGAWSRLGRLEVLGSHAVVRRSR